MTQKYLCPHCEAELNENLMKVFASSLCPQCGKNIAKAAADVRYFPETPGNKVFAVDVYVTVSKCVKLEAADAAAAEAEARKYADGLRKGRTDAEFVEMLSQEGFQDAEGDEVETSGEADETGDIEYY
jgi:ribosomal protein L37AE/L43A